MKPHSEVLRKRVVKAVEGGIPKTVAARNFSVSLSSVKRYVTAAREGRSLAPKKHPGPKLKLDEGLRKVLQEDLDMRPEATLRERSDYLRRACGVSISYSTVSRMLKRMGWARKKGKWVHVSRTSVGVSIRAPSSS